MKRRVSECRWESEVCAAIVSGQWRGDAPDVDPKLRSHVGECEVCSDLLRVALALRNDRDSGVDAANVPPASIVWWRSELRARREAVRKAARPMTMMHALAAACALGVFAGLGRGLLPTLFGWIDRIALRFEPLVPGVENLVSGFPLVWIVLIACGFLLAPVAFYLIATHE